MRQNVGGSVWLVTSNADLDGGISNLALRKRSQRPDFFQRIRDTGGKLRDFLFNLRRSHPSGRNQPVIPQANVVPRTDGFSAQGRVAWKKLQNQVTDQRGPWRHVWFDFDGRTVGNLPDVPVRTGGLRRLFRVIGPKRSELPSRGKLKCVAGSVNRDYVLEHPEVTEHFGALFLYDLIADYAAR